MIRVFYRPCGNTHSEQHTAAYELLDAAARVMGHTPGQTAKTALGKPYFPDDPMLFFSLSHTDGYTVCAIGNAPCGIDIERERKISRRLRERFLDGASEEEAILCWTRRESYGKLEGRGFFAGKPPKEAQFVTYHTLPNHLITVCVWGTDTIVAEPEAL